MADFPELSGDRLRLVRLHSDHSADLHEYSVRPEFYRYLEFDPFTTIEETEAYIDKLLRRAESPDSHYWSVELKETGKKIGTFGVVGIHWHRKSAQIGYGISPLYQGQGYFSEALGIVLRFLFDDLGLNRVVATTAAENEASISALERKSFKREAYHRDFYRHVSGTWMDAVLLALLAEDWRGR